MPIPHLSVNTLPRVFWMRFKLAALTRRSRIFDKVVMKVAFEGDEMIMIPKDNVVTKNIDVNISIDDPQDSTMLPSEVVKALINESNHIFIMNFCLCRRSNKCEDYPREYGCIFMGKGIYKIPSDFGHIATREEALAHVDRCRKAGLVQIIGRNKLDSLWLNTGDKKDLMTICNCCPCCCLWNMVRNISSDLSGSLRRMEGVDISVDNDSCIGCGNCVDICFTRAISIKDDKCVIDQGLCRCCGRCSDTCASKAITITYDENAISKEIAKIESLVDVVTE